MKITYIKKDKRLIFEIEEDIDECIKRFDKVLSQCEKIDY